MKYLTLGVIGAGVAAVAFWGFSTLSSQSQNDQGAGLAYKNATVVAEGRKIYAANCAACHGDNLEGEADWQKPKPSGRMPAPPHDETGHTWHHNDELLFNLTKYGIAKLSNNPDYQTDMPVYDEVLSDDEIFAVLAYIKSTWPQEIQQRHDQMNAGG